MDELPKPLFKTHVLGRPAANLFNSPYPRDGVWGFSLAGRFELAQDEALVVTVRDGGASYTGFQIADPWMVTPDPSRFLVSLNKAQTIKDAGGQSATYVVAGRDPGVANWIDTTGLKRGWLQVRWQGVPAGVKGADLLVSYRVVRLADLAAALPPGAAASNPAARAAQLASRQTSYPQR